MKILVIAPHADDEVLGCGGTLLRRQADGALIGWLLVTAMTSEQRWGLKAIKDRRQEIDKVRKGLGVKASNLFELGLPAAELDKVSLNELINSFSQVFKDFQPQEVFVPHSHDIHSDHRVVFDAVCACTKWFRYPSVRRVLSYETLSETDFILKSDGLFRPTSYVDISPFMEHKLALMRYYRSELGSHPFPRSEIAMRALAQLRGAQSGFEYAEAFQLLRERL